MNNVDITGYIKSVREAGTGNYKVLLASISQRDAFGKCVYTGQIVALDDEVKAQLEVILSELAGPGVLVEIQEA